MFKFYGRNTSGTKIFKAEADSVTDLYQQLIQDEVISVVDGYPDELCRMRKGGKSRADLDEYLEDHNGPTAFDDFYAQLPELTDSELLLVINDCNGKAYFQEITMTQGKAAEYLGVSRSQVSALAKRGRIDVINGTLDAYSVCKYAETRKPVGRPVGTVKKAPR